MRPDPKTLVLLGLLLHAVVTAQDAPTALALQPDHLQAEVDATRTKELVVRFDQDMNQSLYSICGGGPSFPKVVGVSWRGPRTFVIDVELEADRAYSMDLSCPSVKGFWSAAGRRLDPVPWRFATAGAEIDRAVCEELANRLFLALRERYSYRDRLGIDWSDFETRSLEALVTCRSMSSLALRISELLVVPQDPHIAVRWLDTSLPTFQPTASGNFDVQGVRRLLPNLERVGRIGMKAKTADGIGYLFVGSFSRGSKSQFDLCIGALRGMLDCKAIVIDVRQNGGGDENLARQLAGFFVEGRKVYAAHRYRDPRAEDGFAPKQVRTVRANTPPDVFRGPVAVLMGQLNMSSCEAFLLMMKQVDRAHLVGAAWYGSSGNPKPYTLAPGLVVLLPSWQALRPDGTSLEGEGIQPTAPVVMTEEMLGVTDPVLDEALVLIRNPR